MSLQRIARVFSILVLLSMLFAPFQAGVVSAKPSLDGSTPQPYQFSGAISAGDSLAKLTPELRQLAASSKNEPVMVYIITEQGADLSSLAVVSEARSYMDGQLVVATIEPAKLAALAANPAVIAAQVYHPIPAPTPLLPKEKEKITPEQVKALRQKAAEMKAQGAPAAPARKFPAISAAGAPKSPESWFGKDIIGSSKAWDKGYTGEGVYVALLDSGIDFGHPDLTGLQATYPDGPYAGWPIALDPRSMRGYVYYGYTSTDNFLDETDYSWYADTSSLVYCTQGKEVSTEFIGRTYTISSKISKLSKSGIIRLGVHPDLQLFNYVYDWVPIILLDTKTAGVYDTVIADLNFDTWFDDYDPKATKASPVLAVDMGSYVYTDTVIMTGTHYVPDWWWGVVGAPPYWYGYDVADAEMTVAAGSWIYSYDHYSLADGEGTTPTDGSDGIADVSGGMIYYIADGKLPIPGMDYLYPSLTGLKDVPGNGNLVAFMLGSNYAGGGDHGTLCASAIAAQGKITSPFSADGAMVQYDPEEAVNFPFGEPPAVPPLPFLKPADEGTVQGPAPKAKIIAIGDVYETVHGIGGFIDAYTFLAYGVDGVPNSGDELVDVVSISYGGGYIDNDSWDVESRLLAWMNKKYLPNTAILDSAGNGGHGFGSVNAPNSITLLEVAAATQYGSTNSFGGALSREQINYSDIQPFSDKGPSAMGAPDPHIAANGAWGTGDTPLNYAMIQGGMFPGDGNTAWYEWGGTSRAAPEAVGVMALIYNAYIKKNSARPTYTTAQELLMSSAKDLYNDVLYQGAGLVDADLGTDVAAGVKGIRVSPSHLSAGNYQGTHRDAFANLLFPGDTWSQKFTVSNPGTAAVNVTAGDEILQRMQEVVYTVPVTPTSGAEEGYIDPYYYYAHYFLVADPSKTKTETEGAVTYPVHGEDLVLTAPEGADLMQVQLVTPMSNPDRMGVFDTAYRDANPYSLDYAADNRYILTVYDWEDRNADGKLWGDWNSDGIVNPDIAGDYLDIAYTGQVTRTEINRFAYSYLNGQEQEVTVRLRGEDREGANQPKIVVGIVHRQNNNPPDTKIWIKVAFYKKADWGLVSVAPTSVSVPAGGTGEFTASFAIPADQEPGLYEGAITAEVAGRKTIVPTTVNVAVPSSKKLFNFGGAAPAETMYDNSRGFGAYAWGGSSESADWRYYFYDALGGMEQQYLYVRNTWGSPCSNMPTYYTTLTYGPAPDQYSDSMPGTFGPYTMQYTGSSNPNYFPGTTQRGNWWVSDAGIPQAETRSWSPMQDGLQEIMLRNILLSGKKGCMDTDGEMYKGTAGIFGVDAPDFTHGGLVIDTDELNGSFTVDAISPVNGMTVFASGFGDSQWFRSLAVPQGLYNPKYLTFAPDDLFSGWVYTFTVKNTNLIDLQSFGPGSSDIDMWLLYDANNDGVFYFDSNQEVLANSDNVGPDEQIAYTGPKDGTYAVVLYGYEVNPIDRFDLKLTLVGGNDLKITGTQGGFNLLAATPGQVKKLSFDWQVPGPGVWSGYFLVLMPYEEQPELRYQGPGIAVPVTINANGFDLAKSAKTVDKTEIPARALGEEHEILTYTITLVNTGNAMSSTSVMIADLLPDGLTWEMTKREPTLFDPVTSYYARWWDEVGHSGYLTPDSDGYLRGSFNLSPSVSGKVTIEYRVKVMTGITGKITNTVNVEYYAGESHGFISRSATTEIVSSPSQAPYKLFMPFQSSPQR